MAKLIYADNAATTPVYPEVISAMAPVFETAWGNPSSLHSKGREAKALLDDARSRIAAVLGCEVRKAPDITQAHGTAGCCQNKAQRAGKAAPLFFFLHK